METNLVWRVQSLINDNSNGKSRGFAQNSGTGQYWYLDRLMAMSDHIYIGNEVIHDKFGDMIDGNAETSSTGGSGTVSTSCQFKNGTFTMKLHINSSGISTDRDKFGLIGLVAY